MLPNDLLLLRAETFAIVDLENAGFCSPPLRIANRFCSSCTLWNGPLVIRTWRARCKRCDPRELSNSFEVLFPVLNDSANDDFADCGGFSLAARAYTELFEDDSVEVLTLGTPFARQSASSF